MNALVFQHIFPDNSFPWFEDYSKHNTFCKVYNDGSCYIAHPVEKVKGKKRGRGCAYSPMDTFFNTLYLEAKKMNLSDEKLKAFIKARLSEAYPNEWCLDDFIEKKIYSAKRNLAVRKKRFRRKAFLNPWNYFVTITYDDKLHDEESFRKKLCKCLSNLHTRRGWLYMGVFERAPETSRLHFHAIFYIPEGQLVGNVYERRDYSKRKHKMQFTHSNTFFEERFGRNDFESLSGAELRRGNTMNYLLKYLEKTDERIVYSRGIPTEFFKEINDNDIICEMVDFITKYVLFDDVIDYESDVKHIRKPEVIYYSSLPS